MVATNNVFPKWRLTEIWIGGIRLVYTEEIKWEAWDNKRHVLKEWLERVIVTLR